MGQRHQVFVIARVTPKSTTDGKPDPRYRCVAAFHHQWCYGSLPPRAISRFLALVRANAEVVREELRAIEGKYGINGEEPQIPSVPCPFVSTLLGQAYCVELTPEGPSYISGITLQHAVLRASMASWGGDNNDGTSIIDITNPIAPAYCLLMRRKPITAEVYIRGYYPLPEAEELEDEGVLMREKLVLEALQLLKGETLISSSALAEAWPFEYERGHKRREARKRKPEATGENYEGMESEAVLSDRHEEVDRTDTGFTPQRFSYTLLSPFPDSMMADLSILVSIEQGSDASSLDLSCLSLQGYQIAILLKDFATVDALNLSQNPIITVKDVEELLFNVKGLKRLNLMNCDKLDGEELLQLIHDRPELFGSIESIYHPILLNIGAPVILPTGITIVVHTPGSFPMLRGCTLPFLSPSNIIHGLIRLLKVLLDPEDSLSLSLHIGMVVQSAFTGDSNSSWNDRSVTAVPVLGTDVLVGDIVGWVLALEHPNIFSNPCSNWAFLRVKGHAPNPPSSDPSDGSSSEAEAEADHPQIPDFEIHDLRSFLHETALEGRTQPSEPEIAALESLLAQLAPPQFEHHVDGSESDVQRYLAQLALADSGERPRNLCGLMNQSQAEKFLVDARWSSGMIKGYYDRLF